MWRPSARPSVSAKGSRKSETEPEDSDVSTDYTDDKSLSPLHLVHNKVQVDSEEEPEVVYVKTGQSMSASKLLIWLTDTVDSDWDQPKPVVANVATPLAVDTIQDPFNSSLYLGDEENSWISWSSSYIQMMFL